MTVTFITALVLAFGLGIFLIFLPMILRFLGLHPDYVGPSYKLPGKRALIITTSHGVLNKPGETTGKPTGVFGSELSIPYYDFQDSGIDVDVASIRGGKVPIEPLSYRYGLITKADKRSLKDNDFQMKIRNSLNIDDVDFRNYDLIFLAGGWGAAYDLGQSISLGLKISQAYLESDAIIGGVCHGPLGLIQAKDENGNHIVASRNISAVTDKQIRELKITHTPLHPEHALRQAGANFHSQTKFKDIFATHVEIDHENRFVTGQNQNSGHQTAHEMMRLVAIN